MTESDCTAVAGDDCCLKQLTEISCVAVVAAGIAVGVLVGMAINALARPV